MEALGEEAEGLPSSEAEDGQDGFFSSVQGSEVVLRTRSRTVGSLLNQRKCVSFLGARQPAFLGCLRGQSLRM